MKKKFFYSSSYDIKAVEDFLQEQAEKGLMFVKKEGMLYYFEKCEPKKIKFAVDVFEKASVFDTRPEPLTEEYIEYCKEAGWTHCGTYGKEQIFYSEDLNAVSIRTEAELFKNINKNTMLNEVINTASFLLLFVVFSVLNPLLKGLASALISEFFMVMAGIFCLVISLMDIIRYGRFYFKNKRNIKCDNELFFYSKGRVNIYFTIKTVVTILAFVGVLLNCFVRDIMVVVSAIGSLVAIVLVAFLVDKLRGKKENSSRENNITMSVVLVIFVMAAAFYVPIFLIIGGHILNPDIEKVTYVDKTNDSETVVSLKKDQVPFDYESIGVCLETAKYNSTEMDKTETIFGTIDSWEEIVYDEKLQEILYLDYEVVDTKHDSIVESYMKRMSQRGYKDVTKEWSDNWNAKKVYLREDEEWQDWLVEYDDFAVSIEVGNIKLSDEMIKSMSDKLADIY